MLGSRGEGSARAYCRGAGIIYLVLAVLGLFAPTTFGLIPIGGHDIWLHAAIGTALTVVGFSGGSTRVQARPA